MSFCQKGKTQNATQKKIVNPKTKISYEISPKPVGRNERTGGASSDPGLWNAAFPALVFSIFIRPGFPIAVQVVKTSFLRKETVLVTDQILQKAKK